MSPWRIERARARKLLIRDRDVARGDWEREESSVLGTGRGEVEGEARRGISEEAGRCKRHC